MNDIKKWNKFFVMVLIVSAPSYGEGVKTHYTDVIQNLISSAKGNVGPDFSLKCWTTPKNSLFIGVEQRMRIHAPLQAVGDLVRAIDQYDQLFPGFKKISIVSKEGNHLTVYFEQRVPIIFVPNVKYEMLYTELNPTPEKNSFAYQLKNPGTLKSSDGLIILTRVGEQETDYTEYDFFDAEWGLAKIEGDAKLWTDAVEGIYLSDLSLKLKAENNSMSSSDALSKAKETKNKQLIEDCVRGRSEWIDAELK